MGLFRILMVMFADVVFRSAASGIDASRAEMERYISTHGLVPVRYSRRERAR